MVLGDGEILAPVCGLEEGGSEVQMSGFEFVNMATLRTCYPKVKVHNTHSEQRVLDGINA